MQATYNGFQFVNQGNVFKICDQPRPLQVKNMVLSLNEILKGSCCVSSSQSTHCNLHVKIWKDL